MNKKLALIALVVLLATQLACGFWVTVESPVKVGITTPAATENVTEAPKATEAPVTVRPTPVVASNTPAPEQAVPETDRIARLVELDAIYRSSGWQAWLKAAGISCDATNVEARQPEEETVVFNGGTRVVVSGLQLKGNCKVPYPAILTTDRPGDVTTSAVSRTYQPDLKNPSVLYADVLLHGQGTVWVDGSNWGQLAPNPTNQ